MQQPVALDASHCRIAAEMGLANAPAIEQHLVAGLVVGMVRRCDRTGEIDAGHERKTPHDRRLARHRQSVLVIDRRPLDRDGHVAIHEITLGKRRQSGGLDLGRLVAGDEKRTE